MENIGVLLLVLVGLALYGLVIYLPVDIAKKRGHQSLDGVKTLAILSVFIPVLWIVAIIWACVGPVNKKDTALIEARVRAAERETARIHQREMGITANVDAEIERAMAESGGSPVGDALDETRLQTATVKQDECDNCGRKIGKLETPQIWKEHVVCTECLKRLQTPA